MNEKMAVQVFQMVKCIWFLHSVKQLVVEFVEWQKKKRVSSNTGESEPLLHAPPTIDWPRLYRLVRARCLLGMSP